MRCLNVSFFLLTFKVQLYFMIERFAPLKLWVISVRAMQLYGMLFHPNQFDKHKTTIQKFI